MSEFPEVDLIDRLLTLAARYGLDELEVEEAGLKVRLAAGHPPPHPEEPGTEEERYRLWRAPWSAPEEAPPAAPSRPATAHPLLAPLDGTFYRSASQDAPPFVEEGDGVEEGQTVALIEAMKVYSEVPADCAGVVLEVVAANGQAVQRGDILLYIDTA